MVSYLRKGRFDSDTCNLFDQFGASISVDKKLYQEDILSSMIHAEMLSNRGIISENESKAIVSGLESIRESIDKGTFTFKQELEDIHMNVESALADLIGADIAGKLHTARSRNDQVATDVKVWLRSAIDDVHEKIISLQSSILLLAEAHYDTVMPGFTHMQIAQPITFGHHMMAYFEMLQRDKIRFSNARSGMNFCPLGSAALAGTSFPIDRHFVSEELGFDAPTKNSIDAVSDRDFIMEFLSCASICMIHLSRLSEELVNWSSSGMNFVRISDEMTTGSSIMPQKRNPDAAELIRAKSGSVIGAMNSLYIIMKGLPLAYSKDMQEDKRPLFESTNDLIMSLVAMRKMLDTIEVNKANMANMAGMCYSTATDVADWLVRKFSVPFREAHKVVGEVVKLADRKKVELNCLSLSELKSIDPRFTEEVFSVMGIRESVMCRSSYGGTSPVRVMDAIRKAYSELQQTQGL